MNEFSDFAVLPIDTCFSLCYNQPMNELSNPTEIKSAYTHARIGRTTRAMLDALIEARKSNESAVLRDAIALLFAQELDGKETTNDRQFDQA